MPGRVPLCPKSGTLRGRSQAAHASPYRGQRVQVRRNGQIGQQECIDHRLRHRGPDRPGESEEPAGIRSHVPTGRGNQLQKAFFLSKNQTPLSLTQTANQRTTDVTRELATLSPRNLIT